MLSRVNAAVRYGVEGFRITVETDISSGLPAMNIVGLASTTIMEARQRIKNAIVNSGFDYPRVRVTVNLSPADLRKNGSGLDLPIAIGVLASCNYINSDSLAEYGVIGELSLDGSVHGTTGILPLIIALRDSGIKRICIPIENYEEASIIEGINLCPVKSLVECVDKINSRALGEAPSDAAISEEFSYQLDFGDINGQENAKRALSIAVTGRHGLLMIGPPGCGKTMLAKRIPTIMPPMSRHEIIESAVIYSVMGDGAKAGARFGERPFRSPHSTIGRAGLLGGGLHPIPGEISLAHNGVLFLDEVCEFDRENIDSLRLPLEEKQIVHFRQGIPYTFPCNFLLVMASNPCPCGYAGDTERICKCSQVQLDNYRRKLSGPMMDRIDLRIVMEKVRYDQMSDDNRSSVDSKSLRGDIMRGINFAKLSGREIPNGMMSDSDVQKYCRLGREETKLAESAYNKLALSPRAYNKVLKVSRTIADMDESEMIRATHIAEALSYRTLLSINEG